MSEAFDDLLDELKDHELSVRGLISEHKLLIHENGLLRARIDELSPPALDYTDDERDAAIDRERNKDWERSADFQDRNARG